MIKFHQRPTIGQWQQLGYISNDKPSAIFKLKGTAVPSTTFSNDQMMDESGSIVAQIGISIELLNNVPPITKSSHSNLVMTMASKLAEVIV